MVVRQGTRTEGHAPAQGDPAGFTAAVASLHAATLRPEIFCEEMPAPQRIAPYSAALSADVTVDLPDDEQSEAGTGRLILLHDPAGNDAWAGGLYRFVAYARAEVELEIVNDPMLGAVAWSWLTEALDAHGAEFVAASGTVTRVATESFGTMADDAPTAQVEIRASWTPLDVAAVPDFRAHVEAWGELLCTAVGLPPVPEGVAVMPSRRGQRGAGR